MCCFVLLATCLFFSALLFAIESSIYFLNQGQGIRSGSRRTEISLFDKQRLCNLMLILYKFVVQILSSNIATSGAHLSSNSSYVSGFSAMSHCRVCEITYSLSTKLSKNPTIRPCAVFHGEFGCSSQSLCTSLIMMLLSSHHHPHW